MIILHRPKFIVLSDCGGSSLDDLYLVGLFVGLPFWTSAILLCMERRLVF